jgi:hypothetical protein
MGVREYLCACSEMGLSILTSLTVYRMSRMPQIVLRAFYA